MTALVQSLRTQYQADTGLARRLVAVGALTAAVIAVPDGIDLAASAISDAYLQVTVFVAATILVLAAAERLLRTDIGQALERHQKWQVPAGALLGALPGCGGAIVAVTQFTRGRMSFGGVVATLTSTMGDAMFLLLARAPMSALTVLAISMAAGIVTGYLVDAIHGARFLHGAEGREQDSRRARWFDASVGRVDRFWLTLLAPGLALGVLGAFQWDMGSAAQTLGLAGGLTALGLWLVRGGDNRDCQGDRCEPRAELRRLVDDSNFVTGWVIFAFVGYELLVQASGIDLAAAFAVWGPLVPAIAIAVGFIPGCGPQILTTSLYLDGALPLSAQLGNAISNDGDALFPAIAKAPKAAALATLYSAVPAVVVAYGAYGLGY